MFKTLWWTPRVLTTMRLCEHDPCDEDIPMNNLFLSHDHSFDSSACEKAAGWYIDICPMCVGESLRLQIEHQQLKVIDFALLLHKLSTYCTCIVLVLSSNLTAVALHARSTSVQIEFSVVGFGLFLCKTNSWICNRCHAWLNGAALCSHACHPSSSSWRNAAWVKYTFCFKRRGTRRWCDVARKDWLSVCLLEMASYLQQRNAHFSRAGSGPQQRTLLLHTFPELAVEHSNAHFSHITFSELHRIIGIAIGRTAHIVNIYFYIAHIFTNLFTTPLLPFHRTAQVYLFSLVVIFDWWLNIKVKNVIKMARSKKSKKRIGVSLVNRNSAPSCKIMNHDH